MKFIHNRLLNGGTQFGVEHTLVDGTTYYGTNSLFFAIPSPVTDATIRTAINDAVNTFCSSNSITNDGVTYQTPIVTGLSNAPQASIADAPADATTTYNVVTTLLGALTGAVNTANTKQNDIATKLNTLLAELRTLGLISV